MSDQLTGNTAHKMRRDSKTDCVGNSRGSGKWQAEGYILKVESTGLA